MIRTADIRSVSNFRDHIKERLAHLEKTGGVEVLTVNGEAKGVVLSPKAYDELVADAEYARNLRAIRRGLNAAKRGETIPAEQVFAEVRQVLGIDGP